MFEIKVQIPAGSQLIGARTEGNVVVVVCEFIPEVIEPEKRREVGYRTYTAGIDKKEESCSTEETNITPNSTTGGEP